MLLQMVVRLFRLSLLLHQDWTGSEDFEVDSIQLMRTWRRLWTARLGLIEKALGKGAENKIAIELL